MSQHSTFQGFPQEALDFLAGLAANNNKEWFEAHKQQYQMHIVTHASAFVAALGERLKAISPGIEYDTRTNGSGSMMRIYRDTRFSQDKTPYKDHIAFAFWEGAQKKMENPGFGFQFGVEGGGLYAGMWAFSPELLTKYRNAVLDETQGMALAAAIEAVRKAGNYPIQGEHYKRAPAGFPVDHPRANLLKYNGLHVFAPPIPPEVVTSPQLVGVCFEHFCNMAPVQQWLVRLVG